MAPHQRLDGLPLTSPLLQYDHENQKDHSSAVPSKLDLGSASFFNVCFHGINALSGIGICSVPYALASGGWMSLILLFAIALATFFTGLLIQRCMDVDPNIRTYADIGEQAFGKKGRVVVSVFVYLELYFISTCSLILEGDNLYNLFPNEGFEIFGQVIDGRQSFILISGLVILPSVLFFNLRMFSYISASAVFACIIILGSVLWTGVFDGVGFHGEGTVLNWRGIPTAFSLYTFLYCAHPVFPTLYAPMRKKNQFPTALLVCFIFCTITSAAMGILGYLIFGSEVQSEITLSLPIDKLSSKVAAYTTLISPLSKYALMVSPIVSTIENWFPYYCNGRPFRLLIRTAIVFSSIFVALMVPFFGSLLSLVGAFLGVSGSMLVPCVCYLKISGIYKKFGTELVVIVGVLLMGISSGVMGTYTSIVELMGQ